MKVTFFDTFEVKYQAINDSQEIKYFSYLESAKSFVQELIHKELQIMQISYFTRILIDPPAIEPGERFGEITFEANEFQFAREGWLKESKDRAIIEIDEYIMARFDAKLS